MSDEKRWVQNTLEIAAQVVAKQELEGDNAIEKFNNRVADVIEGGNDE